MTDAMKVLAAQDADDRQFVELCRQALTELKETQSAIGGCDHSVNLCQCGLDRLVEDFERALVRRNWLPPAWWTKAVAWRMRDGWSLWHLEGDRDVTLCGHHCDAKSLDTAWTDDWSRVAGEASTHWQHPNAGDLCEGCRRRAEESTRS